MKISIIMLLLHGLSVCAFAQNSWFKAIDLIPGDPNPFATGNTDSEFPTFIATKDTSCFVIIEGGGGFAQIVTQNMLAEIDQKGELLWITPIAYPASTLPEMYNHDVYDLVVAKDGSLYVVTAANDASGKSSAYLNKFDSKGKLLWAKCIDFPNEPVSTIPGLQGLCLNKDSLSVTVAGGSTGNWPNNKIALSKLDSSGTVIWQHLIATPNSNNGQHVPLARMPDSSLKITADDSFVSNYSDFSCNLDSNGNVQSWKQREFGCHAIDLQYHPNGNLVYLSQDEEWFPERGGMRVQMLTPELDTVWSRKYLDTEFPYLYMESGNPTNLSISPDGKILAIGQNVNNSALVCYDPNGDLLWSREVALVGYAFARVQFAVWTSDGGILLNGGIYGNNGLASWSQCFFMKLDSVGCMNPECSQTVIVSTKEIIENSESDKSKICLSPNPAADFVQIELFEKDVSARSELRFSNVLGETVFQTDFSTARASVRTADWPAGLYLAQLFENGTLKKTTRLIVAH